MTTPLFSASDLLDFSKTREKLLEARHLPGRFYTSQEIFDLEVEQIFMKNWICVGRLEQYEKPGDYRAIRIAQEPVLICKNHRGKLNAFANVCAHRGVEVVQGEGNLAHFQCPYHAWVYDLDGKLTGAPYHEGVKNFEWDKCRLRPLQLDSWAGYIFINFDSKADSLQRYLAEDKIQEVAGFLRAEETRVADDYTFEVDCNWKFIPENLMDIYHVGVIHGSSFGAGFATEKFPFHLSKNGYHSEYQSLTMAPEGAWMFEKPMPWLRHKHERFAFTAFIRPTFNMFARPDMLQPWFCHPIEPNKTSITILTQYPEEWFTQPAFDEKNKVVRDFIRLVADEDKGMLKSLQNGVASRNYQPGPIVKLEKAIHHLMNRYLDQMFGEGSTREDS